MQVKFDLSAISFIHLYVDAFSRVDKESNFKRQDYNFMRQLRSNNCETRENMTITLTQKLLENRRKTTGK